jgi:CxxC-x17-CxxC domain-containing protein
LPPIVKDDKKREEIIKTSRLNYARDVEIIEEEINNWASNMDVPVRDSSNKSNNYMSAQSSRNSDSTKLYDAVCSSCGKDTKVIFEPVTGKPVYCKSCLKKIKAKDDPSTEILKNKDPIENLSFNSSKRKQGACTDKPKRREINLSELRDALKKSLEDREEIDMQNDLNKKINNDIKVSSEKENIENPSLAEKKIKKEEIKPGEVIKF